MSRTARAALLALLLAAAAGAGWVAWDLQRDARALRMRDRQVAEILDRSLAAVHDITAAQHAYVAPGQPLRPWLDRVSASIQQIYRDTATLGADARSPGARQTIDGLEDAMSALVQIDTQARERLRLGEVETAATLVFGGAAAQAEAAASQLRALRAAEAAAIDAGQSALVWRTAAATGIALFLAMLGVMLARAPRPRELPAPTRPAEPPNAAAGSPVDLAGLADVCTLLARIRSPDALPDLLGRAVLALDASGLIVWMETDGRLSAEAAHGYDPRAISRMGSIAPDADHATAQAWRSGTLRTVAAGGAPRGAIVAPMLGPDGCIGVVAVEVPPGTDADPARGAATRLLAAQLATALGPREQA